MRGLKLYEGKVHATTTYLHKTAQRQVVISNDAFDLVKLGQVRRVDTFVAEHPVDREITRRRWPAVGPLPRRQLVQHLGADCRRVCPQHQP